MLRVHRPSEATAGALLSKDGMDNTPPLAGVVVVCQSRRNVWWHFCNCVAGVSVTLMAMNVNVDDFM